MAVDCGYRVDFTGRGQRDRLELVFGSPAGVAADGQRREADPSARAAPGAPQGGFFAVRRVEIRLRCDSHRGVCVLSGRLIC